MAKILLKISVLRETIQYNLLNYSIIIYDNYDFEFKSHSDDKINKYYEELIQNNIYKSDLILNNNVKSNLKQEIDPCFKDEFGLTFNDFINMMYISLVISINKKIHTIKINKNNLIKEIKLLDNFDSNKIESFLNLASLSNNDFSNEFYPSHIRNRNNRIIIKPFIHLTNQNNSEYIFNSWNVLTAVLRWLNEIYLGYLPFNENFIHARTLKRKLIEIQQRHNLEFEKDIEAIIKEKAYCYETRIKDNDRCFSNIPEPCPGEIDILSIFKERNEIHIIDGKDSQFSHTRDMSNETKKFSGHEKGYFYLMENKKNFIKKYLTNILDYYKLNHDTSDWKIRCIFVTSNTSVIQGDDFELSLLTIAQYNELINSFQTSSYDEIND